MNLIQSSSDDVTKNKICFKSNFNYLSMILNSVSIHILDKLGLIQIWVWIYDWLGSGGFDCSVQFGQNPVLTEFRFSIILNPLGWAWCSFGLKLHWKLHKSIFILLKPHRSVFAFWCSFRFYLRFSFYVFCFDLYTAIGMVQFLHLGGFKTAKLMDHLHICLGL